MNALSELAGAQLPNEIRLRIFDSITADYIVHAITDRSCEPLIRKGEVAVVTDQDGLYPEIGGWYLMEFNKAPAYNGRERRTREIVTIDRDKRGHWWTRQSAARADGIIVCSDGPYGDFNHLAERILGEVVGIYRPATD